VVALGIPNCFGNGMQIGSRNCWNVISQRHRSAFAVFVLEAAWRGNAVLTSPIHDVHFGHSFNVLLRPVWEMQLLFQPKRDWLGYEVGPMSALRREAEIEDIFGTP